MPRKLSDSHECRSCRNWIWLDRLCAIDSPHAETLGFLCPDYEQLTIRKPQHDNHPNT